MFTKKKTDEVHILIMEQINDVEDCLVRFESFVRACCTAETNIETLRALCSDVCQAETRADDSLRRMIDSLMNGSYLPSTREDIISIASSCDKIANKCEDFSKMVVFQHFKFPEGYSEEILNILAISHAQFEVLEKSITQLFAHFGKLVKDHSILDEIRDHESRVDDIENALYEKTFALDMDLAHQTQIANFLEMICDISDVIENIADKIQIMLVTRKA